MDGNDAQLGTGIWGVKHHVRGTTSRVIQDGLKRADLPPAVDMFFCNCYI